MSQQVENSNVHKLALQIQTLNANRGADYGSIFRRKVVVDVLDYGAKGDGVSDDTAAFSAAIAALTASKNQLNISPGTYKLNALTFGAAGTQLNNLTIQGTGHDTILYFAGTLTHGLKFLNTSNLTLRDLHLRADATVTDVIKFTVDGGSFENGHIENVFIEGGYNGFSIGPDTHEDVAELVFTKCVAYGQANASWLIGDGTQANVLDHVAIGCYAGLSKYGVYYNGGPLNWIGGTVLHTTDTDFYFNKPCGSAVLIQGVRSEQSNRFVYATGGETLALCSLNIHDCTIDIFTATDKTAIYWHWGIPLSIENTSFYNLTANPKLDIGHTAAQPTHVTLRNLNSNNPDIADFLPLSSSTCRIHSLSDSVRGGSAETRPGTNLLLASGGGRFNGDVVIPTVGAGFVATTPDGTKQYRIGIDNAGALTSTQITVWPHLDHILQVRPASLINHLPLDDSAGATARDASGNSRTGTYSGPTLLQTGIGDGRTAVLLDGVNDNIANESAGLLSGFSLNAGTVSFWAKRAAAGSAYLLDYALADNRRILIEWNGTQINFYRWTVADGPKVCTLTASLAAWTHIAFTWSLANNRATGYINGVAGTPVTGITSDTGTILQAKIGSYRVGVIAWFNGYVQHATAWSAELLPGEIKFLSYVRTW